MGHARTNEKAVCHFEMVLITMVLGAETFVYYFTKGATPPVKGIYQTLVSDTRMLAVIFKMKFCKTSILTTLTIMTILVSCDHRARNGTELSESDRDYIRELGLLDENETIILFDGQSDFKTIGNFFTDKRIASYWIDKRDDTKSSVDFGLYSEIDTILTKDLSGTLTYASYLEVVKHDGKTFKVYVDGDSAEVRTFFDLVISEWSVKNNR